MGCLRHELSQCHVHFTSTLNGDNAYSNLVVLLLPSNYLRDHNHTSQEKNETSTLSYHSKTLPSLCGENLLISLQTIYFLIQRDDFYSSQGHNNKPRHGHASKILTKMSSVEGTLESAFNTMLLDTNRRNIQVFT